MKNIIPFRVNEQGVRGVALQVFLLSVISILTKSKIPVAILVLDFFIRVTLSPGFSPLALISRSIIVPITRFKLRIVAYKPKRFAAGIGATMSLLALILFSIGNVSVGVIVLGILSIFSFLEFAFAFCAGCKIFALLIKAGIFSEELCEDCVLPTGDGI